MTNMKKKKQRRWIHSIEITEVGALMTFTLIYLALFKVIEFNIPKLFLPLILGYIIQYVCAYGVILREEKRGGKR